MPYLHSLGIDPATGPDPADLAEGFRERAETLLHMAASARYCYEDFAEVDPKSAKKHLRPVILEPLTEARDRLADLADWSREAINVVIGNVIECPLHQGRFDVRSGKALSAPVCVDLQTFPVQVHDGDIYVLIPD